MKFHQVKHKLLVFSSSLGVAIIILQKNKYNTDESVSNIVIVCDGRISWRFYLALTCSLWLSATGKANLGKFIVTLEQGNKMISKQQQQKQKQLEIRVSQHLTKAGGCILSGRKGERIEVFRSADSLPVLFCLSTGDSLYNTAS